MKNKKAQIRMTETIAVLFIFFILILFGVIFYYKYAQVAAKEKQEELFSQRAIDTTVRSLFLPELLCSKREAEAEDNCVDLMKLRRARQVFDKYRDDYYFNIFSHATISVHQVYPEIEENDFIIYDKAKEEFTRRDPTFFVVTLRDELAGEATYGFGYINVTVYS